MKRVRWVFGAAVVAGFFVLVAPALGQGKAASGPASSSASPPTWGKATEVPGTAALNSGGSAWVSSVSCAGAGDCAAGGRYRDGSDHWQAFVVSEANGTWRAAIEVPGTAALNSGGQAEVFSVSCGAAGDCAAGGWYADGSGHFQAWVVNETNGTWGNAKEVPGTAALNSGGSFGEVSSVSCPAAGDCAAGGTYADGSGDQQAFVANETNGTWGNAIEVPGTGAVNSGGNAAVEEVSCGAPGDCAAGGFYSDDSGGDGRGHAFVVTETNGTWANAIEVPGTATLSSPDGNAYLDSVSCATAGNCAAGGFYWDDSASTDRAYVVNETNGVWSNAVEVPGTAALNMGELARVYSVSCATNGNCAAGGIYTDGTGHEQSFVVNSVNGVWGKAVEVPGLAALNKANADLYSVSCAAAGDCVAGGWYENRSTIANDQQAFVVSETNGTWGKAIEVPGTAALNVGGGAFVSSVSCGAPGDCAAGGSYVDSRHAQAFVVRSHTAGASLGWSRTRGGATITSYDFGAVDGGSEASMGFRLGSSSAAKSGKLAISLTGSSAFSITSDRCTGKSIGKKLSCWVGVAYDPLGAPRSDRATLRATGEDGVTARLSLSGRNIGPAGRVYWVGVNFGGGSVNAVSRGGGRVTVLAGDPHSPVAVAVDATNVYWISGGAVREAPIGGGSAITLASGLSYPFALAVHGTHVYWADAAKGTVNEVPVGGGPVTTLASGQSYPGLVAADSTHVYWSSGGEVNEVPVGGGSVTTLAHGQNGLNSLAVDGEYVYWTDSLRGTVNRLPIGGGSVTTLATGQKLPHSVAVHGTHVYWANYDSFDGGTGTVNEVPVGGGTVTTLASGQSEPGSLAADDRNVYWVNVSDTGSVRKVPIGGGPVTILANTTEAYETPVALALGP